MTGVLVCADEQYLIEQVKEHSDHLSFEVLLEKYENQLLFYINTIVSDRALSADILQETLLKVYRSLKNYKNTHSFKSWLFRVARNTAIDETRKQYYKINKNKLSLDDPGLEFKFKNEDDLDKEFLKEALTAGINALNFKLQESIELFALRGFSYQEIAKITRVKQATVKTRLNRARTILRSNKKLRAFLESYFI